jgi:sialate O-acetylesterase
MKRVLMLVVLAFAVSVNAKLRPAALFTDHAVLQADMPIAVWGEADVGKQVLVEIGGRRAVAKADAAGRWQCKLPALHASSQAEMRFTCGGEVVTIADVLIGEVWIGSGQSNMAMSVQRTSDADETIAKADAPQIRLFTVPRLAATMEIPDVKDAKWVLCSPKTVANFSAALYHFGRVVHEKTGSPVGLIHSSWGGTPIQAWMPREAFAGGDDEITRQRERIRGIYPSATLPATTRAARPALHLDPTKLFNGMIAPLIPYTIRGVTWYQGENNVHQGDVSDYAAMMQAMVRSWRARWGEGDFPFLFVQLAPYGKYRSTPEALPLMWEQQTKALTMIINSGMAVTGDVGDPNDIHPKRKRIAGERLAAIALAKTYDQSDVKWQAPLFKSARRDGSRVRVTFSVPVEMRAVTEDWSVFALAGEDGVFHVASAEISDGDVIVMCDKVSAPKKVRFAWSPIAHPNIVSADGLPAVAFEREVKD